MLACVPCNGSKLSKKDLPLRSTRFDPSSRGLPHTSTTGNVCVVDMASWDLQRACNLIWHGYEMSTITCVVCSIITHEFR